MASVTHTVVPAVRRRRGRLCRRVREEQSGGPRVRGVLPAWRAGSEVFSALHGSPLTGLSPEGLTSPGPDSGHGHCDQVWACDAAVPSPPPLLLASLISDGDMVASCELAPLCPCAWPALRPSLCPCFPRQELPTGSSFPSQESNSRSCTGSSKSSPPGKSPVF